MRPLVFVSSVVRGFEDVREAARRAIEDAGGRALLVNEDFPATGSSPRNVCLDAVAEADAYVVIVGTRGGFLAPSTSTVVEEEFEQAKRLGKPVLAFIQEGEKDSDATRLVEQLEDYTRGVFRDAFSTLPELEGKIRRAVTTQIGRMSIRETSPREVQAILERVIPDVVAPSLRIAVAPERSEELIDPRLYARNDLGLRLRELAHSREVGLLAYENATQIGQEKDRFLMVSHQQSHGRFLVAHIEILHNGQVVSQLFLPPPFTEDEAMLGNTMVVAAATIEACAVAALKFAAAVLDIVDAYDRNQYVFYNALIHDLGIRQIERDPKPKSSYGARAWSTSGKPLLAYSEPRRISRSALHDPTDEADRATFAFTTETPHRNSLY